MNYLKKKYINLKSIFKEIKESFLLKQIPYLIFVFSFLIQSSFANIDINKKNKNEIKLLKSKATSLISKNIYKMISRAYDLGMVNKYGLALKILKSYENKTQLRQSEQSEILKNIGFIYIQMENYNKASEYLQKAIDAKGLSYSSYLSTLHILIQIFLSIDKNSKAKNYLQKYFSIQEKPIPKDYIFLAVWYNKKGDLSSALKYVEKAISQTDQPKENWLKFSLSLNLIQKKYKKSKEILEKLIAQYPKNPSYWIYLSGVYIHLEDYKKALVTMNLSYKLKYLKKENDLLNLSMLFLQQGIPFSAGKILEKSIKKKLIKKNQKNLELMADAYFSAKETKKSLKIFNDIIYSNQIENPHIYIKYGNILLQEEKWKKAESIFTQSLRKINNELRNKSDKIYLGIGIALFYQEKYLEALSKFKKSFELNPDSETSYRWIQYTENALEKKDQEV